MNTMNPIEKILSEYPVMILDGAFATELERRGADLNDVLWSAKVLMENPELIVQVHTDYFEAGADCAITASYQATVEGFMKRGLTEPEATRLIQDSVRLAREARDGFWSVSENREGRPKPLVAASVGPYGAYLADGSEYRGDYPVTEAALRDFHRPRMKALIEAGADVLACETIPCLMEARAIVSVMEEFPGVYGWISFSCRDGAHISNGESVAECARWLNAVSQVAAVGLNCTAPEHVPALIAAIRSETEKPVVVYPNSGENYDPVTKTWGGRANEGSYGCAARHWYDAGARLIGGCCRTTPEDIRGIAAWGRALRAE